MAFIVSKFGGWANSSADNIKRAADLFENTPSRRVKVNSAIGKVEGLPKVTDLLVKGAEETLAHGSFPEEIMKNILLNHIHVFKPLGVCEDIIKDVMKILENYISKVNELSPDHFRALIVGSGEELFSRLDAYYLKEIRGLHAEFIDPKEIGHFLSGHPLDGKISKEGYENLAKIKNLDYIAVYPGFYGVDFAGAPMIYSRGGTDKTASDIAKAVDATLYENWKDVDGIYSADPRIVANPELMYEVTYKEIRELSYISFNVLHQEAMLPVMYANIPINIKNLLKPNEHGTLIVNHRSVVPTRPVIGIASLEGICSINIEKTLMNEELGFSDQLLSYFKQHSINIEQITTGIDSIGILVKEKEFNEKSVYTGVSESIRKSINMDDFAKFLKKKLKADKVQIHRNRSLLCIVGEGMKSRVGILSRISAALSKGDINVEIIDQGPSERNIIIGIKDESDGSVSKKAISVLYEELFS